jgi:hypothetical protein
LELLAFFAHFEASGGSPRQEKEADARNESLDLDL